MLKRPINLKKYIPLLITLIMCVVVLNPVPALALSVSDFFDYGVTATFSKSSIVDSEVFTANITGTATCKTTLPLPVSQVNVNGRVVAKHTSGTTVVLNPGYSVSMANPPSKAGQSMQTTKEVSLQFPAGSQTGSYSITGEVINAQITTFIGNSDITSFLPRTQPLGSLSFSSSTGGGGGGGGGSSSEPTATPSGPPAVPSTQTITGFITPAGILTRTIVAQTIDKKFTLTLKENTKAIAINGQALATITMTPVASPRPAPPNQRIIGVVYDFGPNGALFDPPITLSITYDPNSLNGVSPGNLTIAGRDNPNADWSPKNSKVDPDKLTVSTELEHLSEYTIMASSRPADFKLSDLSVSPAEPAVNQEATIMVQVTNAGDLAGEYFLTFSVGDKLVDTRSGNLAGGAKANVSVKTTGTSAGTYEINVSGLKGNLVIKEPAASAPTPAPKPAPAASPAPKPAPAITPAPLPAPVPAPQPSSPISWGIIAGAIIVVIAIGTAVWLVRRKKQKTT